MTKSWMMMSDARGLEALEAEETREIGPHLRAFPTVPIRKTRGTRIIVAVAQAAEGQQVRDGGTAKALPEGVKQEPIAEETTAGQVREVEDQGRGQHLAPSHPEILEGIAEGRADQQAVDTEAQDLLAAGEAAGTKTGKLWLSWRKG